MKILPCGFVVIEGDTHVSKWVEQSGTLRIAEMMLEPFRKYIPEGGVVVDAGAMIGDHTVTYADWVGPEGRVYAFEPNPAAFECLKYNMDGRDQVRCYNLALAERPCRLSLRADVNAGASRLVDNGGKVKAGASHLVDNGGKVKAVTLDEFELSQLDFLKIDVEGFETRVLRGAKDTINRLKPMMLIEVNESALKMAGASRGDLLWLLKEYGYKVEGTDPKIPWYAPQYDVICIPSERR